jgi:hypothetical protein
MISMKHYYLHDDKSGNEALFQGFRWLKQHSANTGGLIAVPALRNLERYASLQRFEGLKALIKPPNRAIIEGIVYELITIKNVTPWYKQAPFGPSSYKGVFGKSTAYPRFIRNVCNIIR